MNKLTKKKMSDFFCSKFFKINKIIIIIISLFYIRMQNYFPAQLLTKKKEVIIESNIYKSFNDIKERSTNTKAEEILNEINIFKHLYVKNIEKYKRGKDIIHLTVSLNNNNNFKYVLLVSMLSVLLNCNEKKTFVVYHILCSPDFDEKSFDIYKSLFTNFSHNLEMIFYNMGNHFMKRKNTHWSQSTFYRILTPLFINEDRIIHLDGDTLTFSDLSEMYNLDFDDNYILGFYEIISNGLDYLGLNSTSYFNAGVALFNLKKLREDNKTFDLYKLCNTDIELTEVDQTALNYLLYPKIGRLPSKYGIFNFEDESDLKIYYNLLRTKVPMSELEDALNNPGIIHFILCKPKPWFPNSDYMKEFTGCEERHNCSCAKYFNIWHSIANLTDYYDEISNFTGVKLE